MQYVNAHGTRIPALGLGVFRMTEAEMAALAPLARPDGRIVDPEGLAPDWAA